MLNILNGVKLAQDDSTGDLYAVDCADGPKKLTGGGGSVPKPLTYDYMPEGYPTKTMGTVTLMEEQEITFSQKGDNPLYYGMSAGTLEIVVGQTYTVNWDGTAYECVGFEFQGVPALGNLSIAGAGDDTGEPFICDASESMFATIDTSASHTISVKRTGEIVTPMTYDYMPEGYPKKTMGTVALLEEQELAFTVSPAGAYTSAISRHSPEIVVGQTYTVKWDGTEYECVGFKFDVNTSAIGNPPILGKGDDTGEPFLYTYNIRRGRGVFGTHDTSASQTISVKTIAEVITPMAEEFLPTGVTAAAIDNAQTTANNAQTTANNAQTAADNAQTAADNAVKYTTSQDLTDAQKQQARTNIGAGTSSFSGSYNDLTDKPTAVQSDWEVNNDSNVAYIKNRTHYERTEYSSILFRNNPIASSPINDIYYYGEKTGSSLSIDEGNIYKVNGNDGNIYISTCQRVPIPGLATGYAGYVLGNARLGVDAGYLSGTNSSYPITDTGEPWCFISYKNTAKNAIISTISNFRIGSIYVQTAHELKQLDEKYIPSTIQRVGDDLILLSSTEDSTKKFKITVDDNGTISATEVT